MIAAEQSPLETPQVHDFLTVIDDLRPDSAQELTYDETNGGEGDAHQVDVGLLWEVDADDLRAGESVRICLCNEPGRYNLGAVLRTEHGIEALPLAFIELKTEQEGASFSSMAYILEDGEVTALLDTRLLGEAALSEDSQDCYEFAAQLGFGDHWTRAMFAAENDGPNTTSQLVGLNDTQKTELYSFLNSVANRV